MNYYPFHIGDYLSATRHLSWEEDAAFRRLLDTYYTTEKPLPADLRAVCRLVLATTDSQRDAVRIVLAEFFTMTDAGWINSRADTEIAAMREKQQKQRDKANKRWQKPAEEPGNASAMPRHDESDAAASDFDADAMPPTPTPTPTPSIEKSSTSSSTASLPTCPHREVIALFGKNLPDLPQPKPELWDGQRAKDLTARWRWLLTKTKQTGERYATNQAEALAWFDRFFAYVAQSDFLTGRAGSWACDLGWLVKAENFAKVVQGNYENQREKVAA